MTQTLYFKMSNGDDIIATCDLEDSEKFMINYPFTLQQVSSGGTQSHLMMFPWVPSPTLMKEPFIFMKTNIIAVALAPESFMLAHSRAKNALSKAMEPQAYPEKEEIDSESNEDEYDMDTTVSSSTRTLH